MEKTFEGNEEGDNTRVYWRGSISNMRVMAMLSRITVYPGACNQKSRRITSFIIADISLHLSESNTELRVSCKAAHLCGKEVDTRDSYRNTGKDAQKNKSVIHFPSQSLRCHCK